MTAAADAPPRHARLRVDLRATGSLIGLVIKWLSLALLAPIAVALIEGDALRPFLVPLVGGVFAGAALEWACGRRAAQVGVREAFAAGGPQIVPGLEAWSQPGVFAWDRIDPGSALLAEHLPPMKGEGVDLGCGYGALSIVVLRSPAVTKLKMVDLDRRAIQAARRNIEDDRAKVWWSDARILEGQGDKDFVVSNPPFHDGGAEDRRLGQAFIRKAAELLKKGGVAWVVANRHLPYEAELNAAFKRVRLVAEAGGYKLFEAVK